MMATLEDIRTKPKNRQIAGIATVTVTTVTTVTTITESVEVSLRNDRDTGSGLEALTGARMKKAIEIAIAI
jgi:hypothetical protein